MPTDPSKNPPPLNRKQLWMLGLVYDAVARLLPSEGRDYRVRIKANDQTVHLEGITPLGKVFAQHCQANMQQTIQQIVNEDANRTGKPKDGTDEHAKRNDG